MGSEYFTVVSSKTHGDFELSMNSSDKHKLTDDGWKGFCIQSTNTKRKGKNPTLYPCVWKYDRENKKTIVKQVHRVLGIPVPLGHVIDHINGNTFDNRKDNLEVVTRVENTRRGRIKVK